MLKGMMEELKYHVTPEQMLIEQQQVEGAKAEPAKFEALYNRYYEPILSFVYKRVETKESAYDITQQVFLNAMLKLNQFKHTGTPFSSWLYRIAINEINQLYRKEKTQRTVKVEEEELRYMANELDDEEDIETRYEKVSEALSALPEEDIQVVELRFFERRAFKEIAEILNITESNAKVKLYRIIDKLKILIKQSQKIKLPS
ncbi:MAG TPA: sigma-70 family RNA polymerase sigma factor [Bacteroidia bacterium]|jgi:RNA polymerase sigma-70 factor (ECF subfamily)|nr:sigma-70 family RNA polymerase sigma factor [Bacteroidia bacterium]